MRSRSFVGLIFRNQPWVVAIVVLLSALPFGITQQTDEPYIVEPTPALSFGDEDLTTVLLVNNNNRTEDNGGFYMNVRPNIGLLTSTARTFIQEGVTTEYATQVLGTTLDNGRIYAQLLKKSSRVLYEKDSPILPSGTSSGGVVHTSIVGEGLNNQNLFVQPKKLLQSHNDLVADKDWQDVDDKIVLVKESFVGNTDYIGGIPRRSQIVFPVKDVTYSDKDDGVLQKLSEQTSSQNTPNIKTSNESFKIKANKVQPAVDLPTFTIKNMFSPSGFSWGSPPSEGTENKHSLDIKSKEKPSEHRSPKLLYQQIMKEEQRAFSTITYYGFADFTTVVGDSVIVFSPSTSADRALVGQATSIKGEATLDRQDVTYVPQLTDNTIEKNIIEPTVVIPMFSTEQIELKTNPEYSPDPFFKERGDDEEEATDPPKQMELEVTFDIPDVLKSSDAEEVSEEQTNEKNTTPSPEENIFTTTMPQATEEAVKDDTLNENPPKKYEEVVLVSSMADDVLTSTLSTEKIPETTSKVLLSRPSNEEILRIYSSLAQAEAAKKQSETSTTVVKSSLATEPTEHFSETPTTQKEVNNTTPTNVTTEEAIQPDIQIQGGATTIFFEDDPFLDFVSPSSTETNTFQSTQIAVPTSEPSYELSETMPGETTTETITEMPETEPTVQSKSQSIEEAKNKEEIKEETTTEMSTGEKFKPIVKEIGENDQADDNCIRKSQVFLTQIPKTLTYFTTFFLPNTDDEHQTSTFIETNIVPSFDISEATKHYCIQPTKVVDEQYTTSVPVLENPLKSEESNAVDSDIDSEIEITTPMIMVRENAEVNEAENVEEASGEGYDDEEGTEEEEDDQEFGDEIELIYKTLYTTYTYLTTFFHDSTTSVSSRKEVVTNIITSSMYLNSISSTELGEIEPSITKTSSIQPSSIIETAKFVVPSSDLVKIDDILREDSDSSDLKPTVQLDEANVAKTFFTTYTYYTTIFVDSETEIMNRTEVHTNIVGKASSNATITPSARNLQIEDTVSDEDNVILDIRPTATYDTIQRTPLATKQLTADKKDLQSKYTTLTRDTLELESSSSSSSFRSEKKIVPIGDIQNIKIVTDSKSTGSNIDQQIVNDNGVFEDQISSESNTDEIIPSATLLLQTSFTTFTYYTTMYSSDATNVISRLETITNVVTETLQPTKIISPEEATLPITYFTTFTYWTKLAKEGEITTLSREETVSNVVTPSLSELSDSSIVSTSTLTNNFNTNEVHVSSNEGSSTESVDDTQSASIEPTTYYTTYTYYTTSYAGDQTITDSRFETVTNIVTPTTAMESSVVPSEETRSEIASNMQTELNTHSGFMIPPQVISYDYKTIVDAEGISTLYFRTELLATTINGSSSDVLMSTSSINVDEIKKTLSATTTVAEGSESTRTYKTGLVRLIDGTKFLDHTTTVYQSKVIGTIIDQRYAQIIESTSSFIIEKTQSTAVEISASSTLPQPEVLQTAFVGDSSDKPQTIESSISDVQTENENEGEQHEEDESEDEEYENEGGRPRTRLSFQTKKKTFTPVIRPFASRNRPQFAPKRSNLLQSSATIITRSDFTPTITATPAIKSESRGRFSSSRKSNTGFSSSGISGSSSQGGKRFGRPSKSSVGYGGSSSSFPGSSRNRIQSSRGAIQGSSTYGGGTGGVFTSTRRTGSPFRGSSTNTRSFSSAYPGNSRLRIRPTNSLGFESNSNTAGYTTLSPESGEDDEVTQKYESDEENDFTTENLRRNNNPLLRFRRPQVNRPPFGQQIGQRSSSAGGQVSPRRNPLTQKSRTSTTTSTTTTTARPRISAFQRPSLGPIQNRARPQSNLFPPRRLFQPQNVNQVIDEEQQKPGDDFLDTENEDNDSSEYENDEEGEDEEQEDQNRRRRESSPKLRVKKRSKRQTTSFRNRFRRPSTTKPGAEERVEELTDDEPSTARSRTTSRFNPRTHSLPSTSSHSNSKAQHNSNNRAIRPTKPNSNNRAQFTLREKETTSKHPSRPSTNFRRPTPNGVSSRRTTTAASRPKAPRLKNYGNTITESPNSSSPRGRTPTSRSRSTARGRSRSDFTTDPVIPSFDGTITVTHTTPTEITIPVVNGKVTEYKNVLTSTTSTEVLLPNQYTTIVGPQGSSTLVLNREDTSINVNGATEVTQFILHESPTTTVVFTPTTIRGRKTSFAHMIPSTAYQVENIVSTMQAQIAANAPLANILLSQLLLGNLGSLNQPNINPLLALGGAATQPVSQVPGVPITEYKTRSSTYVTTVTNGMSTVIPLTFHGKEILTTIYDSSSDVITATEYITETIIVTPTQQAQQVQQVNSLLLPYLLQQQLQGSPTTQPTLPIQNSIAPQLLLSENLQDLDTNGIQKYNDYGQDIDDYANNNQEELIEAPPQNTNNHGAQRSNNGNRKKNRKSHKQHAPAAPPAFESSVITLYVSGRRPGEFSTVLSTVQIGHGEASLHKRQVSRPQAVFRSVEPNGNEDYEDYYRSAGSEIEEYLLPASNDISTSSQSLKSNFLSEETQSLESIVGDVGLWYAKTSVHLDQLPNREQATVYNSNQSSSSDQVLTSTNRVKGDPSSQSKNFLV